MDARDRAVNDSRRVPWLSGLVAAVAVALWPIASGVVSVIDGDVTALIPGRQLGTRLKIAVSVADATTAAWGCSWSRLR